MLSSHIWDIPLSKFLCEISLYTLAAKNLVVSGRYYKFYYVISKVLFQILLSFLQSHT